MLKVYDTNFFFVTNFNNYKDLEVVSELSNGDKTLTFTYIGKQTDILNEYYIETEDDFFVVKEVNPGEGSTQYLCKLNLEALEASMFRQFTAANKTITEAAALALAGTGWTVSTAITKTRSVQQFKKTPLEMLYKIRDAFMCEIWFDTKNKVVHYDETIGSDKGVYFRRELNLKSLDATLDSYDYYTRLVPFGKDGMEIDNDGKNYVENYQYSSKVRTLIWEDTSYEDADALKEDATKKLNDLSKPKRSYSVSVRDMAKLSPDYDILAYELGDTIYIVDELTGVKEKQRIVKITEHPDDPYENQIELSNTILSWEEFNAALKAAADAWEDVVQTDGTIDGGKITGNVNGIYVHGVQVGDVVGIDVEIQDGIDSSDTISSMQSGISTNAQNINGVFNDLTAINARIGNVETTYLKAADAEIEYAKITNLNATEARIGNLEADYGTFKSVTTSEISAAYADIDALDADYANIKTLLSGTAVTGDLHTIMLNASNTTVDTAFIHNLIVQNVVASDIFGNRISTTDFTVGSDSGNLEISDNTIAIKDNNDNVRIQLGEDAHGDYNLLIYDSTGTGLLFGPAGVTESGIADGLIKNAKIAGDANISASKLDIQSLFTAMNGSNYSLNSSKVYLDDQQQSLTVAFANMSNSVSTANGNASDAVATANAANSAAQTALAVIQGISTLDALGASLTNDAHVVHTLPDGSGGVYTNANTKITVYLGDTDVNRDTVFTVTPSTGVVGTWNPNTWTYQVTDMSVNDGYVDFECSYGIGDRFLISRTGKQYLTRSGKALVLPSAGSHIKKRFSISKAPDGRVGISYDLQVSTVVMTRDAGAPTIVFSPASVTMTALENDNGTIRSYTGKFVVEETTNGTTWTLRYKSATPEVTHTYTPTASASIKAIRITLKDPTETFVYDYQTIAIIADADVLNANLEDLADEVVEAQDAIAEHSSHISTLEATTNGLSVTVGDMNTKLTGVIGGDLLYQVRWNNDGTRTTLTAKVYKIDPETKVQTDVTDDYPSKFFTWSRRSEDDTQDINLGSGKTKVINNADVGYNGLVDGWFYPYREVFLTTRSGKTLTTRSGKAFVCYGF